MATHLISAITTPPSPTDDPLTPLVKRALTGRDVLVVLARRPDGQPLPWPTPPDGDALSGQRCPDDAVAVAYGYEVILHRCAGSRSARVGVGVARHHDPVIVDAATGRRLEPDTTAAVLIDRGRRALGLATPAPDVPVVTLFDRQWLHLVLRAVLAADPGDPPGWRELGALHPLSAGVVSPGELCGRRAAVSTTWDELRAAVGRSRSDRGSMPAHLARWHDAGSFARHLLCELPDPDVVVELDELLRPDDSWRIRAALGMAPTSRAHRPTPSASQRRRDRSAYRLTQ